MAAWYNEIPLKKRTEPWKMNSASLRRIHLSEWMIFRVILDADKDIGQKDITPQAEVLREELNFL